ncbi:MAG TPA: cytochrome d ubiquinol oxidase subunit II, partial [Thermoleophilia bacterium]|nr:cytochrome d ubiquinol oxidase subunit II [Thermoleophilia bacterium]
MDLQLIWYLLIGVLLVGYAVLDGYDLGVGILYPFVTRTENEKRELRTAIGPVWDGNEVWLITAGGALFAAFPFVYATVFSGFYLAIMLLLFSLIFRAVSVEYRAKDPAWRGVWDRVFFVSSALIALLLGVTVGNLVRGVPLTAEGEFDGNFFTLLHPYPLLVGVVTVAMFVVHGAAWGALRTQGDLRDRLVSARKLGAPVLLGLFALTTAATFLAAPDRMDSIFGSVLGWLMLLLVVAGLVAPLVRAMSE